MITVKVKEERKPQQYDYTLSSLSDLDSLLKNIYAPIIGRYSIGLTLKELRDVKYLINNKGKYNHVDITVEVTDTFFKKLSLAMPDVSFSEKKGLYEYFMEGVSKRNLLLSKNVARLAYSSVGKSYSEIDELLDVLYKNYGSYMSISESDLSKHIVVNTIVYPRTVLINYINLTRWRKSMLNKCLSSISPDIVLASMIKTVKKLHSEKDKYFKSGVAPKYIRELNTRNLNLMYYILVINKPRSFNDITILLEMYERGISFYDLPQ